MLQQMIEEISKEKNQKTTVIKEQTHKNNFEHKIAILEIEAAIPSFKAKLLQLQQVAQNIMLESQINFKHSEKLMDKNNNQAKKIFVEVIEFIFNNPLKAEEFIINNQHGVINLTGSLGYLFDYFSKEYGINIEQTSEKLAKTNKNSLFFNKDTKVENFIEMFNKNYYQPNNDDSLV